MHNQTTKRDGDTTIELRYYMLCYEHDYCCYWFLFFMWSYSFLQEEELARRMDPLAKQLDNVMHCLKRTLKQRGTTSINYFEFCFHPTDFSRTVANAFYTSFLVKENKVALGVGDDNMPLLSKLLKFYVVFAKIFHVLMICLSTSSQWTGRDIYEAFAFPLYTFSYRLVLSSARQNAFYLLSLLESTTSPCSDIAQTVAQPS